MREGGTFKRTQPTWSHVTQMRDQPTQSTPTKQVSNPSSQTKVQEGSKQMFSRKRLLSTSAALLTIASLVALVAGVTFGLFSATTPSQSGTFTAGTVTLDQTKTITCTVGTLSPGDGSY